MFQGYNGIKRIERMVVENSNSLQMQRDSFAIRTESNLRYFSIISSMEHITE